MAQSGVGAVVVKDGVIVGRGWTQPGGRPHAETEALKARRQGRQGRDALCHARTLLASRQGSYSVPTPSSAPASTRVCRRWRTSIRMSRARAYAKLRERGIVVDTGLGADEAALALPAIRGGCAEGGRRCC